MSRPEVIQVQFQPEEAERVRASAESMGLSQSAYIRMLVMAKVMVPAWWAKPFDAAEMTVRAIRSEGIAQMRKRPQFILELMYETQNGGAAYKVFDGAGAAPLTFDALRDMEVVFRELHRGRIMMGGSHMLWHIVRSVQDINLGGQLVWLLNPDTRKDSDPANS